MFELGIHILNLLESQLIIQSVPLVTPLVPMGGTLVVGLSVCCIDYLVGSFGFPAGCLYFRVRSFDFPVCPLVSHSFGH